MDEKFAHMSVVLVSLFAILPRYVQAQMNTTDNQGIRPINNSYITC